MNPDMPVGDRIRYFRKRRGMSQAVLADLVGMSESWLGQVERGVRSVDRLSTVIELARVLKVNVTDLTGKPFSLAPNGGATLSGLADIRKALTTYGEIPAILNPTNRGDISILSVEQLRRDVAQAYHLRQASRYWPSAHCCRAYSRPRASPLASGLARRTAGRR